MGVLPWDEQVANVARATALAEQFAYNSSDVLAGYPGWQYFLCDEPYGAVVYVQRGSVLVANGDPLCAPEHTGDVLRAFAAFARHSRQTCAFLGASARLQAIAVEAGFGSFKVGEEIVFDLATYAPRGDRAKKARAARNQAIRAGVVVRGYCPSQERDEWLERQMTEVANAWLATRPAGGLGFSLRLEPLRHAERKQYFIAEHEGRVVAFVACSSLPGRQGVYLEDVLRLPDAPYGCSDLLILHALEALAAARLNMATLGVAPLQRVEEQDQRCHRALGRVLAGARDHAGRVYRFNSLNHFKRKFGPTGTEQVYLLYQPARITPWLIVGLLGAFTPNGLSAWCRSALLPAPRSSPSRQEEDRGTRWLRPVALAGLLVSLLVLVWHNTVGVPVGASVRAVHLHLRLVMLSLMVALPAGGAAYVRGRARRE